MIRHTGKPLLTTALSSALFAGGFTGPALAQELSQGHLNIIGLSQLHAALCRAGYAVLDPDPGRGVLCDLELNGALGLALDDGDAHATAVDTVNLDRLIVQIGRASCR
uniref:hypothetical protein n=2 Tax=Pararhodobacter marinus TaxID=2184063 RepID=UPI003559C865